MAGSKWEYVTAAKMIPFENDAEDFATGFMLANRDLTPFISNTAANLQGGGWELVSHAITPTKSGGALFTGIFRRTLLAHRN